MTHAVVFDLWRTLVPLEAEHKEAAMAGTVAALGADDRALRSAWAATRSRRETVPLPQYFVELQDLLGTRWTDEQVATAMHVRRRAHFAAFSQMRADTFDMLQILRRRRVKTGLISNCSSDVRGMLKESGLLPLFDDVVLSAEVGLMKPDPQIFRLALSRLGVQSGTYVGDGGDDELTGAREAGMRDVLLDLGEGRHGLQRVTSLSEVPSLLEELSA